jgi:hypothetical protein
MQMVTLLNTQSTFSEYIKRQIANIKHLKQLLNLSDDCINDIINNNLNIV